MKRVVLISLIICALDFSAFSQDTTGSQYVLNCQVPSDSPILPNADTFCDNLDCESGFYKINVNEYTVSFPYFQPIPGVTTPPPTPSYVCVSNCESRGTHFSNLMTRTCERCDYPCPQCNSGTCENTCIAIGGHCFTDVPGCVDSDDEFLSNGNCYFGCPGGFFPNVYTKTCDLCYTGTGPNFSCARCNGPSPNDCTACNPGQYLNYTSPGLQYGNCLEKSPNPPELDYYLLVSHREQDRNSPTPEAERDGSEAQPYTDLRSALNKAEELAAPYKSQDVTITVYLSKGPHFITLTDEFYYPRGVSQHFERNYKLVIQPLYADNGLDITNTDLVAPDGSKVTIYNKIGAYFSIDVPLSLEVQNLVFDSLDSLARWNTQCLGSHAQVCYLNTSTKEVTDLNTLSQCGCATPKDHSLNNCIAPTATSLFKMPYYSTERALPHPRTLHITGCSFQNFFHPINSIVGIPVGPSMVRITETSFLRFSSCGAVVKNEATPPDVSERRVSPGNNYLPIQEDQDVFSLQYTDNGVMDPSFSDCPRKSNISYGQECHHLIIEHSSFQDFDYFFKTEFSLAGFPHNKAHVFRKNQYLRYRAPLVHLEYYEGFIQISGSTFKNIKHYRPECYFDSNAQNFNINILPQESVNTTFSDWQFLKLENPIIITRNSHGFWFHDNLVQNSSGTRGFIYLTLKPSIIKPSLISENRFENVAGFLGSAVIHATLVENNFDLNSPDYDFTCGGFTLRANVFEASVSCNIESPTIRVDCTNDLNEQHYEEYSFQIANLADWTTNQASLTDETKTLGFGNLISGEVSTRSVEIEDNVFTKTHRGQAASEIMIIHVPSVNIRNLTISLSSSLSFITPEFQGPFGQTSLIPEFKSTLVGEPGSLIQIRQALWVHVDGLKVSQSIMSYREAKYYGVLQLEAVQKMIELNNLEINKLQSGDCSGVYAKLYSQKAPGCSQSSTMSVETPIVILRKEGSQTSFTPEFTMAHVLLRDIIFEANGSSTSLVVTDKDTQIRQMDFTFYNLTLDHIQAEEDSAFRWKGNRFNITQIEVRGSAFNMMLGTDSSARDQNIHSMTLREMKVTDTSAKTLIRLDNYNEFLFEFANSDPSIHYFDSLDINNYFLYVKYNLAGSNATAHISNLTFSNIRNTQPSTNANESPLFVLTMGGDYIFSNISFQSRPGQDLGQLLASTSSEPLTLKTYNMSMVNLDGSESSVGGQAVKLNGALTSATFHKNNFTGIKNLNFDGAVIQVISARVRDIEPYYSQNSGKQGGVYHISNQVAEVTIEDGIFANNSATENGGAIFVQGGQFLAVSTNFTGNIAGLAGGAFINFGEGMFQFQNCRFEWNRAIEDGSAIKSLSNPQITGHSIRETLFANNIAQQFATVSLISTTLKIKNSNFTDNYSIRKTEGVSLTQSKVDFQNCLFSNSTFDGERNLDEMSGSFIYISEESVVTITENQFTGGRGHTGGAIEVQGSSELRVRRSVFFRNEADYLGGDIYGSGFQLLIVESCKFSNSSTSIGLDYSPNEAIIKHNIFQGFKSQGQIVTSTFCLLLFQNNTVTGFIDKQNPVIFCENNVKCIIERSNFTHIIAQRVINMLWTTSGDPPSSNTHQVSHNRFEQVQSPKDGGAIQLFETNTQISNNTFIRVSNAQYDERGGAIYMDGMLHTDIKIEYNHFEECSAYIGGAIAYNNKEPVMIENTFDQTVALLSGDHYASYPQSVRIMDSEQYEAFQAKVEQIDSISDQRQFIDSTVLSELIGEFQSGFIANNTRLLHQLPQYMELQRENEKRWEGLRALSRLQSSERGTQSNPGKVKSGTAIDTLYLGLYDNYGNIINDREFPSRSLQASLQINQGSQIPGVIQKYRQPDEFRGIFKVSNLTITAEPSTTVELIFTATIDGSKELAEGSVSTATSFDILPCQEGEEFLHTGKCVTCQQGFYLLEAPSTPTSCIECPQNAVCYEGNKIGPVLGYWRSGHYSTNFIQCFNKNACLGASEEPDEYEAEGTCADGYEGILCAQCKENYVRNGSFQCGKCPEKWQNIFLLIIVVITAIIILVILIKITLSSMKERKSPFSAYFKILTNHLHLILLTASFDLSWPQVISDFFRSTEPVANVSDRIISVDCFMDASDFNQLARPYMYLLIYLFMPLVIVLVSLAVWGIIYRGHKVTMCNRTITTSIILLFLVHPSITTLLIRVFHCFQIDKDQRLVHDLSLKCWTSEHMAWALGGALPGIILWGIGIPLAALLLLYCSRHDLDSPRVKEKYGFLYNGYRHRLYYWESVIMFRKVAMIFITVLLSSTGRIVQALFVILLLIFYLFYTIRKKPYTTRRLNELEITSLLTSSITIYCGVFFLSSRENDPSFTPNVDMRLSEMTKWVLVIVILFSNTLFLILWIQFFFTDVRHLLALKFPRIFRCLCLCCHRRGFERSKLQIKKSGQDFEIINLIEDVESDLSRIKYKYVFNQKFKDKWEFEDYLRSIEKRLSRFNTHPMKLKEYRKMHSLEESEARFERETDSKNQAISSIPTNHHHHHLQCSSQNVNTRGVKEEEMMVELNSIRPQLDGQKTSFF